MNTKTLLLIILLLIVLVACSFLGYTTLQQTLKPNTAASSSSSKSTQASSVTISSSSNSLSSMSSSSLSNASSSKSSTTSSKSFSSYSSISSNSSTSQVAMSGQVKVYLIKNSSGVDYILRDSTKTDPLDRIVDAMNAKIKGPNSTEVSQGFAKDITMSGTANCYDNAGNLRTNSDGTPWTWMLSQKSEKIFVRFCKPVTLQGSVWDGLLEQSIKSTVTSIVPGSTVVILNSENNCLFNLSGLNQCGQ